MKKGLAILLVVMVSLCITQKPPNENLEATPEHPLLNEDLHVNPTPFGIHTHQRLYKVIPQLGASWSFTSILWGDVEPEQDVWNFEKADKIIQEAQKNQVNLIVKIRTGTCWATREKSSAQQTSSPPEALEDYTEFVHTVVDRYKDAVDFWAVENEMNTQRFWIGTLEEYNQLIETAYTTIKEVDPSAQVLDSGMASMTYGMCIAKEMYEKGEVGEALTFYNEYYTRRGVHISSEEELKEVLYSQEAEKVYIIMMNHFDNPHYDVYQLHYYEDYSLLDEVIHFIRSHLQEKQIFAVEMGYAYRNDATFDEKEHAEGTVKLMVSLLAEGVPVQVYLPLIDLDKDNHEEWRGLVSLERERRPALYAYRVTTALLKEREFTNKVESAVCWYEFGNVTVVWSEEESIIDIPVKGRAVIVDIYGGKDTVTESLSLTVGPSPLFIVKGKYESEYEIGENIEIVEFPSYDGVLVEGFLVRPEGDKKFPAVVLVHGGVSSQKATVQMAEHVGNRFAEKGYVALAVHYRDGPLGLQDVEDTLSGIQFLKQLDFVNPERIGVYGGSHGGYVALMCAWRSDVKAVVEAAGFCDLADMAERLFQRRGEWMEKNVEFYGGYPDEVPDVYMDYSPCGHVAEFQAAVFIIHGKMDTSVPVEHAYMLSELLENYKKPYEMYISETGEHGFYHTRSEEAQKVWELIFQFFEKYLKS